MYTGKVMRNKREHLVSVTKKDFDIQWFRGSGSGGQHKNKHPNCCRMTHRDSGVTTQCTDHKSREANQKVAFQRMVKHPQFNMWLKRKSHEVMEKMTLEEKIDRMMVPENLKIETRENGKWVEGDIDGKTD